MGIFVGAAGVGVLSAFMDVPEFSLILCTMIGLGVGIDYALFIVTRHRQHLHEGMSVEDAAGTAERHRRPGRAVRRHDRRHRHPRPVPRRAPGHQLDGRGGGARGDRLDGRRHHAAARPARPGRHEDRQALDPPQVPRRQARRRDVLRSLGAPRRQPPGALRGRRASSRSAPSPSLRSACASARPTTATPPTGTTQRIAYDQLAAGLRPRVQRPDPGRRRGPGIRPTDAPSTGCTTRCRPTPASPR